MKSQPHWSSRYVGIKYVDKEFDCAELASQVMREVYGKEINLPSGRMAGAYGRARMIAEHRDEIARAIHESEAHEGDALLIGASGYDQHIGIVCDIAGERWILHNISSEKNGRQLGQVIRTRLRELTLLGYKNCGFYRWI